MFEEQRQPGLRLPVLKSEKYYYPGLTPNSLLFSLSQVNPAARVVHLDRNPIPQGEGRTWELKKTC
jgi:hypothetical protein